VYMRRSLLFIVDVQEGGLNKNTAGLVEKVNKLSEYWYQREWPVVFSRFINLPGSNWQKLRNWHEFEGEPDTLLAKGLTVKTPYIFKKSTYNAWSSEVRAVCLAQSVTDVAIVGMDTNECVLATATAVFDDGFTPWVIKDACASTGGEKAHNTVIPLLEALLGKQQIITIKEIL
jgi:nicotinamidase-related amidase